MEYDDPLTYMDRTSTPRCFLWIALLLKHPACHTGVFTAVLENAVNAIRVCPPCLNFWDPPPALLPEL